MSKKRPLKVGFDLDGVLLYNPARIIRRPIEMFKERFLPKRVKKFYIPKSSPEKLFWRLLHWSSMFVAPGLSDIETLKNKGIIEPYIITARFDFLEKDFNLWLKYLNRDNIFKGTFLNTKNEQPHIFKEKMIKKLDLDIFIDDNWNIVEHLSEKTPIKIMWVYNILDRKIDYKYKHPTLKKSLEHILNSLKLDK